MKKNKIMKQCNMSLIQGGCQTLKTLKSDLVALKTLKNKYFSVENLEVRVYYRESFQLRLSSVTLSTKLKSTKTNHCILFIFRYAENVT